jgi:cell division septation protein DedD
VLESRHLVGLFVLMVVIFGVVFVLGYELGRNQYGEQVRAATETPVAGAPDPATEVVRAGITTATQPTAVKPQAAKSNNAAANAKPSPGGSPPTDYDFYKLGQPNQPPAHLTSPPKNGAAQPVTNKNASPSGTISTKAAPSKTQQAAGNAGAPQTAALNAPLIPRGAFLLQVAALTKEGDALALAQALQKKKFPAFVLTPTADHFYHVQVGPYSDAKTAEAARKALENAGFKAIVKH